jgi:kynurenine formamidase
MTVLGKSVSLIDLSHPLGPNSSEPTSPRVEHTSHATGAELWHHWYGVPESALPQGLGFAGEIVTASTHAGTHIDAPWHYAPTSEGEPAWKIQDVPPSWFFGPLVIVDVSDLPAATWITPHLIDQRLAILGHRIEPGDIVVFHTGAGPLWGTPEFWEHGAGLGREGVLHLVDAGVRVIGTDAWSLDRPYPIIGTEWAQLREPERLWPAHFAGIDRRYCQIEKLARLAEVPAIGATIMCPPIKIAEAGAGWTRAVALVPN